MAPDDNEVSIREGCFQKPRHDQITGVFSKHMLLSLSQCECQLFRSLAMFSAVNKADVSVRCAWIESKPASTAILAIGRINILKVLPLILGARPYS
jgi:hypothetical protein